MGIVESGAGEKPPVVDEGDAEKRHRVAREAEDIAAARAELDSGLYATSAEVKAWIDSIGTDRELPVPYPIRRR